MSGYSAMIRIRWKYRVHEQILAAICQAGGHARWSDVVIHHTGYQNNACLGPKLERALRLLQLDLADNPQEPFTLFNLGWTLLKLCRPTEAVSFLRRSLEKSQPGDSIVRKTFALLVECHKVLGQMAQALDVCRQGRRLCPDDAEMLFEEGCLTLDQGNLLAAEACFTQLLEQKPGTYFASVDPALFGLQDTPWPGCRLSKATALRRGRQAMASGFGGACRLPADAGELG